MRGRGKPAPHCSNGEGGLLPRRGGGRTVQPSACKRRGWGHRRTGQALPPGAQSGRRSCRRGGEGGLTRFGKGRRKRQGGQRGGGGGRPRRGRGRRQIRPQNKHGVPAWRGGREEQSQAWLSGRPAAATPFPAYGSLHRQRWTLPALPERVPGPASGSRPCQSPPWRGLPDGRKAADAFARVAAFSPSVNGSPGNRRVGSG